MRRCGDEAKGAVRESLEGKHPRATSRSNHEDGNVGVCAPFTTEGALGRKSNLPLTGCSRNGPGASNRGEERSREREHLLLAGLEPDERCSKRDKEHQRWVRSRSRLVQLAKRDGSARFKRGLESLAVGRNTSAGRIVRRRSVH